MNCSRYGGLLLVILGLAAFAVPRNDITLIRRRKRRTGHLLPLGGQTTRSNTGSPVPSFAVDMTGAPWPTHIDGSSVPTAVYTAMHPFELPQGPVALLMGT